MRRIAVIAALLCLATATPALAEPDTSACGWTGDVTPLISSADRKVMRMDFTKQVTKAFGSGAQVSRITRLQLDLGAAGSVKPTDAAGLTRNQVVYRLTVTVPGADDEVASVALRYNGLCYRTASFTPRSWVGTIGFEEPSISAERALRLAERFRRIHADTFPNDNPLTGMQLMRATTRPPDFGKLRWFVDYEVAPGVVQVLAVYMNGTVKVAVR